MLIFVKKKKKRMVEYRRKCKEHESLESKELSRVKTLERVRKHRQKIYDLSRTGFKCVQSRAKAVAKVMRSLPKSPGKQTEVLSIITETTTGLPVSPVPQIPPQTQSSTTIKDIIENFYRSDAVSQVSSETKHRRSKQHQDKEIRVMTLTIMEAYAAFCNEHPKIKCSDSVFRKLRPETVFFNETNSI